MTKDNDYIICLINDKIFIFDEGGNLLTRTTSTITSSNVEYYSLVYLSRIDPKFYFAICFINDQYICLYGYRYNTGDKKIEIFS